MLEHARDEAATAARCFAHPDSHVSNAGHEYLEGIDKTRRRSEVMWRDGRRCWKCGELAGWQQGEMHHVRGGNGPQRCDCLHNLKWSCGPCHREEHVQVGG